MTASTLACSNARLELPTRVPAFIVQIHESNHKYSSAAAALGGSNYCHCHSLEFAARVASRCFHFGSLTEVIVAPHTLLQMVRFDRLQTSQRSSVIHCYVNNQ